MGSSDTGPALSMTWQMFAVTLNGLDVNPQFVTPDTLRYNGVVDSEWTLSKGALFGLSHSAFTYSNGVSVTASEESLCFRQTGDSLNGDDVLCDRLMERYLAAALPGTWFSALTEFGILVDVASEPDGIKGHDLPGLVEGLKFEGVYADSLRTFFSYQIDGRRLSVNLSVSTAEDDEGLLTCHGSVQRYLDERLTDGPERLLSLISDWLADYRDVVGAVERYISAVVQIGGSNGR